MALSISSLFKKKSEFTLEFRGKQVEYKVTEEESKMILQLGLDGKIKNGWNEPVWIRVEYEYETGRITCYATKAFASIKDGKVLFANYGTVTHPDFFPLEQSEIQMLIDFVIETKRKTEPEEE